MTHVERDLSEGDPMALAQRPPKPVSARSEPRSASVSLTIASDDASFAAGQDCGTRVAACLARLSALELMDGDGLRWWNRRGHRRTAAALVAYAEELESGADAA